MRLPIALFAFPALALSAGLASAQDAGPAPMAGTDHSAMTMGTEGSSGTMAAYMEAMETMNTAMANMDSTGDADADFLLMMIPHHRSAVDMSKALLPVVKDPEVRALAEAVIATQEAEIASMTAMLARLGYSAE